MKMAFIDDLNYWQIFGEKMPDTVESLLGELDTVFQVLPRLSFINSILHTRPPEVSQLLVLTTSFDDIDQHTTDAIWRRLGGYIEGKMLKKAIFSINTTLEFINYELINMRCIPIEKRVDSGVGLNIFKAYVWFQRKYNHKRSDFINDENIPERHKDDFFQWAAWPILFDQYEYKVNESALYKQMKFDLIYEYLEKGGYSKYCKNYLEYRGVKSRLELTEVISQATFIKFYDIYTSYYIRLEKSDSILDMLSIRPNEYKADIGKQRDFIGVRERPLYKVSEGYYLVLHWGFFENLFDITYLFDFHRNSGVKEVIPSFILFKKQVGDKVLEKIFLRKLIEYIFPGKYVRKIFDEIDSNAYPDAYVRDGNDLYLFEFKDALAPSDVSLSYDVDSIKKDIESKFVRNDQGKRKGVSQLSHAIKNIIQGNGSFDDSFLDLKKNVDKLRIYPIILYTHVLHGVPGVNSYVNKFFDRDIEKLLADILFKGKISPVTMMSLEFFVDSAVYFKFDNDRIKEMIDKYNENIRKKKKSLSKINLNNFRKMERTNEEFPVNRSMQDMYGWQVSKWTNEHLIKKGKFKKEFLEFSKFILGDIMSANGIQL